MESSASNWLLADFLAQAPEVPAPSAAEFADKLRHDLAVASRDADYFARAVMAKLHPAKPSAIIAQGSAAIDELLTLLAPLVGSLEMARLQIKLLEAQGVSL